MSSFSEQDIPGNKEEVAVLEHIERLKNEKQRIVKIQSKRSSISPLALVLGFGLFGFSIFLSNKYGESFQLVSMVYAFALIATGVYLKPSKGYALRIVQIDNEIDLLNTSVDSLEKKAEKLFRNHQFELKGYYDQTLTHSSQIFYVGIICIFIGFAIIGLTIYYFITEGSELELNDKVVIASLSALGNVLTGYIGTIYLKMFSEITKSLNDFHSKLVLTHNLHFSNYLAAKIKNNDKRDMTVQNMINEMVKK